MPWLARIFVPLAALPSLAVAPPMAALGRLASDPNLSRELAADSRDQP
jgi:hypothetical protein